MQFWLLKRERESVKIGTKNTCIKFFPIASEIISHVFVWRKAEGLTGAAIKVTNDWNWLAEKGA